MQNKILHEQIVKKWLTLTHCTEIGVDERVASSKRYTR